MLHFRINAYLSTRTYKIMSVQTMNLYYLWLILRVYFGMYRITFTLILNRITRTQIETHNILR